MSNGKSIVIKRVDGHGQDANLDLYIDNKLVKHSVPMDLILDYLNSISDYTETMEEMESNRK